MGSSNVLANGVSSISGLIPSRADGLTSRPENEDVDIVPDVGDCEPAFDLICVGFGPANLSLAIALSDVINSNDPPPGLEKVRASRPRVLFLEQQKEFCWHEGMLLPSAKMQITFIKDLATLRDPKSHYTFLNYLHQLDRLVPFTNLDTFLPSRLEYQDYMKWCASHFNDAVLYNMQVTRVAPKVLDDNDGTPDGFEVCVRDVITGSPRSFNTRRVLMAVGGRPYVPKLFPERDPRIIHSSRYLHSIEKLYEPSNRSLSFAVVGAGQSAAEVFDDLQTRYPKASTTLITKSEALRPSDDSPFVNEIFDPNRVGLFYDQSTHTRDNALAIHRNTNYGVVRPALLQHIYDTMYAQRVTHGSDERYWQHRIVYGAQVLNVQPEAGTRAVRLKLAKQSGQEYIKASGESAESERSMQSIDYDAVIVATGYERDAHETLLHWCRSIIPYDRSMHPNGKQEAKSSTADDVDPVDCPLRVRRDYKLIVDPTKLDESKGAGVWLQGCNERTHGLSDTLLSILATRSLELVYSMFGDETEYQGHHCQRDSVGAFVNGGDETEDQGQQGLENGEETAVDGK